MENDFDMWADSVGKSLHSNKKLQKMLKSIRTEELLQLNVLINCELLSRTKNNS